MANRDRNNVRSARRSAEQSPSGRPRPKKKKMNPVPIFIAAAVLVVLIVIFVQGIRAAQSGSENTATVFFDGQPEFFSTIRPEKMNTAEVDPIDDPEKAAAYFENSLFIGDSRMAQIRNCSLENERLSTILKNALFLTSEQYSWRSLAGEFSGGALTFNLYGDYVSLAGAVEKVGAKKVFILLGSVDLASDTTENTLAYAGTALSALKQACPDLEIIVLPLTPVMAESSAVPGNDLISGFNLGLQNVCTGIFGLRFADTASLFPAEGLTAEYCADPEGEGADLNAEGCVLWVTGILDSLSVPQTTAAPTAEPTAEPQPDGAEPATPETPETGTESVENTAAAGRDLLAD